MSNPDRSKAPIWLELIIDRAGNDVRLSARGSRDEQVEFRSLGIAYDALIDFATNLEKAATYGQPLTAELLATARAIHEAVTDGEIGLLLGRLTEAAQGSLLVRFLIHDPTLKSVPWEAICSPHQARGFWAVSPELFPVRGILSSLPWKSIGVENAVHVLAIAPTDEVGLVNLQQALSHRIPSGEVAWLEPLKGPMATKRGILERLRCEPRPHVIHFVGHGRVEKDVPALRAADEADEECWLDVEVFAQEIAANLQGQLRLVVLEACEGARQSAFSSAAEIIAHAGVQAVVAHGWPVRANIAQICSTQLYHTLVGAQQRAGNIVTATNDARRAILTNADGSAESISPILYLRGADGALFNFEQRKLIPLILGGVGAVGVGIGAAVYKHSTNNSGNLAQQNIHPDTIDGTAPAAGEEFTNSARALKEFEPPAADDGTAPKNTDNPRNKKLPALHGAPPPPPIIQSPPATLTFSKVLGVLAIPLVLGGIALFYKKCPDLFPTSTVDSQARRNDGILDTAKPPPTHPTPYPTTKIPAPAPTRPVRPPPLLDFGAPCTKTTECKSNFCVDGVCCNSACTGSCQACSRAEGAPNGDGTCVPIPAGQDPKKECGSARGCNGRGACVVPCGPTRACPVLPSVPAQNGATCRDGTTCQSGFCVDGVCCDKICADKCYACSTSAGASTNGQCGPVSANFKVSADECPGTLLCTGRGTCRTN